MSVGLLFDTRDNGINAQRGWLASTAYRTFFDGFLGGDSTWQELYHRRAHVPQADAGRPAKPRVLVPERQRRQRRGAVLRSAGDRQPTAGRRAATAKAAIAASTSRTARWSTAAR